MLMCVRVSLAYASSALRLRRVCRGTADSRITPEVSSLIQRRCRSLRRDCAPWRAHLELCGTSHPKRSVSSGVSRVKENVHYRSWPLRRHCPPTDPDPLSLPLLTSTHAPKENPTTSTGLHRSPPSTGDAHTIYGSSTSEIFPIKTQHT